MNAKQLSTIKSIFSTCDYLVDVINDIDINEVRDISNINEFNEYLESLIIGQEIIYYTNAINFLQVHDTSLRTSLNLASELGYSTRDLDSETLATILLQKLMFDELSLELDAITEVLENDCDDNDE